LRKLAQQKGKPVTREYLQELGDELVRTDVRAFCEEVLKEQPLQPGVPLVIDGVRHLEVLHELRDLLAPAPEYLFYINVDRSTQLNRLKLDDLPHEKPLEELELHPTEIQVRNVLPDQAHLVLDGTGTLSVKELAQRVVEFVVRAGQDGGAPGWDEKNGRRIELAEKKSREQLTGAELAEFDQLQTEYFDYLDAKHPRTPMDENRLAEVEARLKASEGD
jgi:hypothetical protein